MENQKNKKGHSLKYRIFNYTILTFILVGIVWVVMKFMDVSDSKFTDNAQVKRRITPINSRVQGYIKEVRFTDFARVKKGDTLLIIDNSEYLLQLAQAQANLANALAGKKITGSAISTTNNNISVSKAAIDEIKVRLDHAETELKRYKNLLAQSAVTKEQYDRVRTEYDATKAKYDMMTLQTASTVLSSEEQIKRLSQNDANIKQAKAAYDIAELNLSYTVITAPCDGIVGKKSLIEGQLVQHGQSLVSIVSDDEVWIIANYKEKQVKNISMGNDVEIEVDGLPGIVYSGKVAAMANATGSEFSMIPVSDNSTGNFVKIEQLIPVRINFKNNSKENIAKLKSGMSAEVKIK